MIRVSTFSRSVVADSSAIARRREPSKVKGLVTTPMVSAPLFRAISATTGAAPDPVPPPMPAVRNTMSAPCNSSESSCWLSSAASRPIVGLPPAPRPRVSFLPMFILVWASEWASACRSVLMAMNSTPRSFDRIMRLTALLPPPPIPTTLIRAFPSRVRSTSRMASSLSRSRRALTNRSADTRGPWPPP